MQYNQIHHAILSQLLMTSTKPKFLETELKKKDNVLTSSIISQCVTELVEAKLIRRNKSTTALQLETNGFWVLVTGCLVHQFPPPNWFLANRIGAFNILPIIGESISHGKDATLPNYSPSHTLTPFMNSPYALPLFPYVSEPWQALMVSSWSAEEQLSGKTLIQWDQLLSTPSISSELKNRIEYARWEQDLLLNDKNEICEWAWYEFALLLHTPSSHSAITTQLDETLKSWQRRTKKKGFPPGILPLIWLGLYILADHNAAEAKTKQIVRWLSNAHPGLVADTTPLMNGMYYTAVNETLKPRLEYPDEHVQPWGYLWCCLGGIARQDKDAHVFGLIKSFNSKTFLAQAPEHLLMELSLSMLRHLLDLPVCFPIFDQIVPPPAWENWLKALNQAVPSLQQERVIWILKPDLERLECKVQKMSAKGGWTQGRSIDHWHIHRLDDAILDKFDQEILYYLPEYHYSLPVEVLEVLSRHPRLFNEAGEPLQLQLISPLLEISKTEQGITCQLTPEPETDGYKIYQLASDLWQVVTMPPKLVPLLEPLKKTPKLPPEAFAPLQQTLDQIPHLVWHSEVPELSGNAKLTPWSGTSGLRMNWQDNNLRVQLVTEDEQSALPALPLGMGVSLLRDWQQKDHFWKRDLTAEKQDAKQIRTWLKLDGRSKEWHFEGQTLLDFMQQLPAIIEQHHLHVSWHEQSRRVTTLDDDALSLRISRDQNWFQVEGELQIDKQQLINLRMLLRQLKPGEKTVVLDDKTSLLLTDKLATRLETLAALLDEEQKISSQLAYPLTRLLESISTQGDDEWRKLKNEWQQVVTMPDSLLSPLRDYQKEGANWLATLAQHGFGACLADDMGLGKTLQALTLLRQRHALGPALVIVPKSLVLNWQQEAARFAPELNMIALDQHHDRQTALQDLKSGDVVLVNYGLLGNLNEPLQAQHWASVVADESQQIKNAATQRAKVLFTLNADFRLALSGTPVENHLGELWSLFNFINPGLLGNQTQFKQRFSKAARDPKHLAQLRGVISPFVLRRLKQQVLTELPEKTEIVHHVSLSDEERALYEATRLEAIQEMQSGEGHALIKLLASLTRLRRVCCSPALLMNDWKKSQSKLDAAMELITEAIENNHRILVFSQFVDLLTLLRQRLEIAKLDHCYLDGSCSSKQRQSAVSRFQQENIPLFLISLKAGGTGLNLTQADTVIHLDPWWNPAVEDQASDRAHRMGQTQPVTVYRLVCEHTVEEKIVALHAEKRALADGLLSEQAEVTGLDVEVIKGLLGTS